MLCSQHLSITNNAFAKVQFYTHAHNLIQNSLKVRNEKENIMHLMKRVKCSYMIKN
jgi:hypothetical protein